MRQIALLVIALFGVADANAQGISGVPFIAVHGEATRDVVPDVFPLEITLEETSKDLAKTQEVIESLAQRIIDLAKAQNVAEADLTVGNLSIDPKTEFDDAKEEQVFVGNTYTRVLRIRFHALEAMQRFLRAIPDGKSVQIGTGEYSYSKTTELRRELMATAIDEARKTADEIAGNVGKRIVGVHTVSDRAIAGRYVDAYPIEVSSVALLAPGTVRLTKGEITIQQDAYVVYLIGD